MKVDAAVAVDAGTLLMPMSGQVVIVAARIVAAAEDADSLLMTLPGQILAVAASLHTAVGTHTVNSDYAP